LAVSSADVDAAKFLLWDDMVDGESDEVEARAAVVAVMSEDRGALRIEREAMDCIVWRVLKRRIERLDALEKLLGLR
jgi:hypothetical protein